MVFNLDISSALILLYVYYILTTNLVMLFFLDTVHLLSSLKFYTPSTNQVGVKEITNSYIPLSDLTNGNYAFIVIN